MICFLLLTFYVELKGFFLTFGTVCLQVVYLYVQEISVGLIAFGQTMLLEFLTRSLHTKIKYAI